MLVETRACSNCMRSATVRSLRCSSDSKVAIASGKSFSFIAAAAVTRSRYRRSVGFNSVLRKGCSCASASSGLLSCMACCAACKGPAVSLRMLDCAWHCTLNATNRHSRLARRVFKVFMVRLSKKIPVIADGENSPFTLARLRATARQFTNCSDPTMPSLVKPRRCALAITAATDAYLALASERMWISG